MFQKLLRSLDPRAHDANVRFDTVRIE